MDDFSANCDPSFEATDAAATILRELARRGYASAYPSDRLGSYIGPGFLDTMGVLHGSADDYRKARGFYPRLARGGVCYGFREACEREGLVLRGCG